MKKSQVTETTKEPEKVQTLEEIINENLSCPEAELRQAIQRKFPKDNITISHKRTVTISVGDKTVVLDY